MKTAPPALELEEARGFRVDIGEDVVVLVPEGVRGIEVLEVLHQLGTVENAVSAIRHLRRQPRAAGHAARVAHRVVALTFGPRAAPVGHRRTVDDYGPGVLRIGGSERHRRPATLAVAYKGRLRAVGVPLANDAHELFFGLANVEQRLAGLRIAEEDKEVHGMACGKCDADL